MKRRKTKNQKAYDKEVKRIKNYIKKKEKEGFIFDYELPEKPKRITKKKIEELKSVKYTFLLSFSKIKDEKGEIVSGRAYQNRKKQSKYKKNRKWESEYKPQHSTKEDRYSLNSFSLWNELRFVIANLPTRTSKKYRDEIISQQDIDVLLEAHTNTTNRVLNGGGDYSVLDNHVLANQLLLSQCLHVLNYESQSENVITHYSVLLDFLNYGDDTTLSQAEIIG